MIYIEKDTTNTVVLTLWESATIDNPYWAFRFTNESTGDVVIFLATDTSGSINRYNMFSIIEQDSGLNPLTGIIQLSPVGQWYGEIYESVTASLDPDDWGLLVQTEIVVVSGDDTSVNEIYR